MAPRESLALRAASVGLALGMLFALGVVIGSRSPAAIEHYDPLSAAMVLVKIGASTGAVAALAGALSSAIRKMVRNRRKPIAAPTPG